MRVGSDAFSHGRSGLGRLAALETDGSLLLSVIDHLLIQRHVDHVGMLGNQDLVQRHDGLGFECLGTMRAIEIVTGLGISGQNAVDNLIGGNLGLSVQTGMLIDIGQKGACVMAVADVGLF